MNKNKLVSVMKLHGDTGQNLADYLGVARTTISAKINETRAEFTQREISKIKKRYNLTPNEVDEIFFEEKVSLIDT
ncbi:MAG: hypothetical protein R3Y58_07365 [Eubacteriales bacterium]